MRSKASSSFFKSTNCLISAQAINPIFFLDNKITGLGFSSTREIKNLIKFCENLSIHGINRRIFAVNRKTKNFFIVRFHPPMFVSLFFNHNYSLPNKIVPLPPLQCKELQCLVWLFYVLISLINEALSTAPTSSHAHAVIQDNTVATKA